ncbi:hypothetical protein L1987_00527 [Smallanthus sonchifolius]|uniref:Uncharacterized protein n=1 Tax=Smallanthus sonchifolius TaxID=185202 RepID=A0ACB9K2J0_9ASTR|nr:hypothetical protein L1987_00527 [Smallanthus sonchifolius]
MDHKSLLFFALFISFGVPFAISQEVDDEHEFTYDVNSPNGPYHWGEIHSEFNLELHLVHQSIDKKVAVVGILYKIGRPDSFLTTEAEANARPIQALNNRWLKLYRPNDDEIN